MCPTAARGVPCFVELLPFEVAADERRFGDVGHVLTPRFVAVGRRRPELLVHRLDGLARCHPEVALEHFRVPVVAAQHRGPVAEREMRFHLKSNGRFVGRLQAYDALGMPERGCMVAAFRSIFCQPHKGRICLSSKFFSLVQNPVVITSWKEIARIKTCGELEITRRQGIAEPQHVNLARPSRIPLHSLVVDLGELADVGKGMTQFVKQLSQVGVRLTLGGVGPKLERES
jgi:hypothetical protein